MDDKAGDLRRHATHCRFLARSSLSEWRRTILFTMAMEFEGQAAAMDGPKADPTA